MPDSAAFWSYVHADDAVDGGRVSQLGRDLVGNYEALTGDSVELFLDADTLHWGDEQREKIDDYLSNVAFFIPVITPRYFMRPECRRELQFFTRRAEGLGLQRLVMPILYIAVPGLDEGEPEDELMRTVKRFQWEPWGDLRFADRDSQSYRWSVARLAAELVTRVAELQTVDIVAAAHQLDDELLGSNDDDAPGLLEQLVATEEAIPRWVQTISELNESIQSIGTIVAAAQERMEQGDRQGRGFAARLTVSRDLAQALEQPVGRIEESGQSLVSDLHDIDTGVRIMVNQLPQELEGDPEALQTACETLESLRKLATAIDEAAGGVDTMVIAGAALERLSRDLRPPVRRLREGLTFMSEARQITQSWVASFEELALDCSEFER